MVPLALGIWRVNPNPNVVSLPWVGCLGGGSILQAGSIYVSARGLTENLWLAAVQAALDGTSKVGHIAA
jgi:hypothetical protein